MDISHSGQAILAVLPFTYDPDFLSMLNASSVVRTDYTIEPIKLPCNIVNAIKTFKQFHII
jgi:hypothetical protein